MTLAQIQREAKFLPNPIGITGSARSTGRGGTNTLSFAYPHKKKSQSVKSDLLCGWPFGKWHVVVRDSSNPSKREIDVHRCILAHWPNSVVTG
ncbi:hypothetical protein TNCV_1423641 [Trichonephila clavipes]|nr:hypothetical protein TNCV_1423641 [Trichonephila clavipes]